MVNMSNKTFLVVILLFIAIAVIAVLVAVNFMNWGTALAGFGGPIAAGLYEIFAWLPRWVLNGGWPTMIAGIAIAVVLLFTAGYFFEKKEIYATITGTKNSPAAGNYQSSPSQNIIPLDTSAQSEPSKKA